MAHTGKSAAVTRKPVATRLVTLFALIVFAFQGYLVQTHIHGAPLSTPVQFSAPSATSAPAGQSDPYNPASCPLCQEIVQAGAFVTPDIITLPLQLDWIVFLRPAALPDAITIAHSPGWQSRAPPRR